VSPRPVGPNLDDADTGSILVVSGPAGVGKSTVSRLVAGAFDRSVHLQTDDLLASIVRGGTEPSTAEGDSQNLAVGAALAVSAMSFAAHGYTAVVDGPLFPDGVEGLAAACAARPVVPLRGVGSGSRYLLDAGNVAWRRQVAARAASVRGAARALQRSGSAGATCRRRHGRSGRDRRRGAVGVPGRPADRGATVANCVFIADDQPMVRSGLALTLETHGIEVIAQAADGAEAVRLARELRPDVCLLDIRMPVLDGLEATRILAAVRQSDSTTDRQASRLPS
jgi:hypothetical protein